MLKSIGDLVEGSVKRQGIENQVQASQVIEEFHKTIVEKFGKRILSQVQAKSLKNQVLNIATLSSVVTSELRMHEEEILERINNKYKKTLVNKLRFFI